VPPKESVRPHQEAPPPVRGEQLGGGGQEGPIAGGEVRPHPSSTEDPELVAEHGRLEISLVEAASDDQAEQPAQKPVPDGPEHPVSLTAGWRTCELPGPRADRVSLPTPKAVGLTAAAMQEFANVLGIHAEVLGPSQWEPRLACVPDFGPRLDEVTEGIRAQGAPPDYPAAQAYAACLIAQHCLEEADTGDQSLWRAACALDCRTFFGRFHIDPAAGLQVGHEMVLVQWRRGRKLVVWPPPVSKAKALYPRPQGTGASGSAN
jgi:hypothetical protein